MTFHLDGKIPLTSMEESKVMPLNRVPSPNRTLAEFINGSDLISDQSIAQTTKPVEEGEDILEQLIGAREAHNMGQVTLLSRAFAQVASLN